MRISPGLAGVAGGILTSPQTAFADSADLPDLTGHWVGFAALGVFAVAYALVISEEVTNLPKSKPMVVAAGVLWTMIGIVYQGLGLPREAAASLRHVFLEYGELLLFLVVAM